MSVGAVDRAAQVAGIPDVCRATTLWTSAMSADRRTAVVPATATLAGARVAALRTLPGIVSPVMLRILASGVKRIVGSLRMPATL